MQSRPDQTTLTKSISRFIWAHNFDTAADIIGVLIESWNLREAHKKNKSRPEGKHAASESDRIYLGLAHVQLWNVVIKFLFVICSLQYNSKA
jgi:hypothetical protein